MPETQTTPALGQSFEQTTRALTANNAGVATQIVNYFNGKPVLRPLTDSYKLCTNSLPDSAFVLSAHDELALYRLAWKEKTSLWYFDPEQIELETRNIWACALIEEFYCSSNDNESDDNQLEEPFLRAVHTELMRYSFSLGHNSCLQIRNQHAAPHDHVHQE